MKNNYKLHFRNRFPLRFLTKRNKQTFCIITEIIKIFLLKQKYLY